jgi:hypothetical protein
MQRVDDNSTQLITLDMITISPQIISGFGNLRFILIEKLDIFIDNR